MKAAKQSWHTKPWRLFTYYFMCPYNLLVFKVTKNEVLHINGLRPKSAISLNDVINCRTANMSGRDPEPLVDEWVSDEDYTYEIDRDPQRGFKAIKIHWRTKRDYIAKHASEQGTAFVLNTATIPEGMLRTRRPRGIFLPIFYLMRMLSGLVH